MNRPRPHFLFRWATQKSTDCFQKRAGASAHCALVSLGSNSLRQCIVQPMRNRVKQIEHEISQLLQQASSSQWKTRFQHCCNVFFSHPKIKSAAVHFSHSLWITNCCNGNWGLTATITALSPLCCSLSCIHPVSAFACLMVEEENPVDSPLPRPCKLKPRCHSLTGSGPIEKSNQAPACSASAVFYCSSVCIAGSAKSDWPQDWVFKLRSLTIKINSKLSRRPCGYKEAFQWPAIYYWTACKDCQLTLKK